MRFDPLGQKRRADVHTPHGLTVEFQHSHLRHDERAERESFYGNMLWVVDGSKPKGSLRRFLGQTSSFKALTSTGLYLTPFPEDAFPPSWLSCSVPVLFDYENGIAPSQEAPHLTRSLWCLLPGRVLGKAVVWEVAREPFVRSVHNTAHPIPTQEFLKLVEELLQGDQRRQLAGLRSAQGWRQQGVRRRLRRF